MAPGVGEGENFPRGRAKAIPTTGAEEGGDQGNKGAKGKAGTGKRKRPSSSSSAVREDKDFLFGGQKKKVKQSGAGKATSASTSDGKDRNQEAAQLGIGSVSTSGRVRVIEPITTKRLVPGAVLLGIITSIGDKSAVVALPNNLTGHLPLTQVSDTFYNHFAAAHAAMSEEGAIATLQAAKNAIQVGQVVRCVVASLESRASTSSTSKSKRVVLTLRASAINRGVRLEHILPGSTLYCAVGSAEDHGYVLHAGAEGFTCFLPKKHARGGPLVEGQPVEVVVLEVKNASRTVTCGIDPQVTPKAITRGAKFTLASLKAGMLVNTAVDAHLQNGLLVNFLGFFTGAVEVSHLDRAYQGGNWRKCYPLGAIIKARILMIDQASKSIYLTLRPHLLDWTAPTYLPEVGEFLQDVRVLSVEAKKGLMLGLRHGNDEEGEDEVAMEVDKDDGEDKGEEKDAPVFTNYLPVIVHRSKLQDAESDQDDDEDKGKSKSSKKGKGGVEQALKNFKPGQNVSNCRVIGTSLVDGAVFASLQQTTLDAPFVRTADVKVGQVVKSATVSAIASWGYVLDLGQGVKAHCTAMHLSDAGGALQKVKTKGKKDIKVGQAVTCRILTVDPATRKIYATMKRSLIKDKLPALVDYQHAQVGVTHTGFVTKVESYGVIVTFCGNVHGLLPRKVLAKQGVDDVAEAFRVGQVVRCVVSSCDCQPGQRPRLTLRLDVPLAEGEEAEGDGDGQPLVNVGQIVSGVVEMVNDPPHVMTVKLDGGKGKAVLHKHQLGDLGALADGMLTSWTKGDRVENCLVMEMKRKGGDTIPLLTMKPLLLKESTPIVLSELAVGQELVGYVSKIQPYGMFIRFVGGESALAPKAMLADHFVEDPSTLFHEGDSARCVVQRALGEDQKVIVATKRSLLPMRSSMFLESSMKESARVALSSIKTDLPDWQSYPNGTTINARVSAVKDYGVVLVAHDNTTTLLAPSPHHVLDCNVNDEVKVRVLDIDWARKVLLVTLLPDVVKEGRKKRRKSLEASLPSEGSEVDARVLLKKDRYAVVLVGGVVGFMSVADYHCPFLGTGKLEFDQVVKAVVRRSPSLEEEVTLSYPQEKSMFLTWGGKANETVKASAGAKAKSKESLKLHPVSRADLEVGNMVTAVVSKVRPDELLLRVNLSHGQDGDHKDRISLKVHVTNSGSWPDFDLTNPPSKEIKPRAPGTLPSFHPLSAYHEGQKVTARIVHVAKVENSLVPRMSIECSLRSCDLAAKETSSLQALIPSWENLAPGQVHNGVIVELTEHGLWMSLSRILKGFIHHQELKGLDKGLSAASVFQNLRAEPSLVLGASLPVLVRSVDRERHHVKLSIRDIPFDLRRDSLPTTITLPDVITLNLHKGQIIEGKIHLTVTPVNPPSVQVQLSHRQYGRVCITELQDRDRWVDRPFPHDGKMGGDSRIKEGQTVPCRVLSVEGNQIELSLRPSRLDEDLDADQAVANDEMPEEGEVVKGYVINTTKKGCFVRVNRNLTGRVLLKDMADTFIKDPSVDFPPGRLVACKVLAVKVDEGLVDLSLRPSAVVGKAAYKLHLEDMHEGMKVKGGVTRVEPYGVFIRIQDSDVTGLCHISEAAEKRPSDLKKLYETGDLVKAMVIKVDSETKRVNLSLKPSRFAGDEDTDSEEEEESEEEEQESEGEEEEEEAMSVDADEDSGEEEEEEGDDDDDHQEEDNNGEESEEEEDDEDDEAEGDHELEGGEEDDESQSEDEANGLFLTEEGGESNDAMLGMGVVWDDFDLGVGTKDEEEEGDEMEEDDDEDDDDEGGDKHHSHSSRKKAAERRREEERIREKEAKLLSADSTPETAEDFERFLLAQPNSSFLWIQYMAFQLSLADIDAARNVAERALKKINFRQEQEKMNVWVALLNLEHKYGTPETVADVLARAAQHNNPKHVYLHAVEMYERAGEDDKAEEIYQVMTKRFRSSKKVWMKYHVFALRKDSSGTKATELLKRSLQSLSKHKHTMVISNFAQMEYVHGSVARGRTIFEGLVSSYPKRLDLWNIYVDKEVKSGHIEEARHLLDRMCTLKLSVQKMKGVFKKFLQLEMEHGNEATVEAVKEKAKTYVESHM